MLVSFVLGVVGDCGHCCVNACAMPLASLVLARTNGALGFADGQWQILTAVLVVGVSSRLLSFLS